MRDKPMARGLLAAALVVCQVSTAFAGAIEDALKKLAPEERSHQACALRGLDAVRKDARLHDADRMKSSIFSRAVLNGNTLVAEGGAVRSGSHWYALSYKCQLTNDLMKATAFSFAVGAEFKKRLGTSTACGVECHSLTSPHIRPAVASESTTA
jgi:hypothetical protein